MPRSEARSCDRRAPRRSPPDARLCYSVFWHLASRFLIPSGSAAAVLPPTSLLKNTAVSHSHAAAFNACAICGAWPTREWGFARQCGRCRPAHLAPTAPCQMLAGLGPPPSLHSADRQDHMAARDGYDVPCRRQVRAAEPPVSRPPRLPDQTRGAGTQTRAPEPRRRVAHLLPRDCFASLPVARAPLLRNSCGGPSRATAFFARRLRHVQLMPRSLNHFRGKFP